MRKTTLIGFVGLLSLACLIGCGQDSGVGGAATAAYVVANFRITDAQSYAAYSPLAGATLVANGAELLVADGESEAIEGQPEHVTVVIKFPSKDAARAWYNSAEYQEILHLRTDNSEGFFALTDGFVTPE